MNKLTEEQQEELINVNTDYYDQITDEKTLESALYKSIESMNKEMITYLLDRNVKIKVLPLGKILKASDNLKYIQFLEEKGIDFYNGRVVLDAIQFGRDKTTIYLLKNYKGEKDIFKIPLLITIDSLNAEKKEKKIKAFENIIPEIFALGTPNLKNDFFNRIKSEDSKSIILEKYLKLQMKDIPEPTKKVKANKI